MNGILNLNSFKVPPHRRPITYEGKTSNQTMEKSLRHDLNVSIIRKGTNENHAPPDRMQGEYNITTDIPAKCRA